MTALSVVVATRNRAADLDVCLQSLARQDPRALGEVIVVDDGSTDGTPAVVGSHLDAGFAVPLVFLRRPAEGAGAARNSGIGRSRQELIWFLDDDVRVASSWAAEAVAGADRHPEVDAFAGRIKVDPQGETRYTCRRHWLTTEFDAGRRERLVPSGFSANLGIRRRALRRSGGFDESIVIGAQETELLWRVTEGREGDAVLYLPRALAWHRLASGRSSTGRLLRDGWRRGLAMSVVSRRAGVTARESTAQIVRLGAHIAVTGCGGAWLELATHAGALAGRSFRRRIPAPRVPPLEDLVRRETTGPGGSAPPGPLES